MAMSEATCPPECAGAFLIDVDTGELLIEEGAPVPCPNCNPNYKSPADRAREKAEKKALSEARRQAQLRNAKERGDIFDTPDEPHPKVAQPELPPQDARWGQ